jgi:Ca2+-transporting ATPase
MDHIAGAAGLSQAEAALRLAAEGPNALPSPERHGVLHLLLQVAKEPMFLLLIGACATYLLLGDRAEALALAASLVVVFTITVVQERRTERTLERLRDLSSPRALVIRDGAERRIAGRDVVRGELLVLREGDRVAADAELVDSHDLQVDESLLTGESVPVVKGARADVRVYSGTLVVRGVGRAVVSATGPRSQLGRIGATLSRVDPGKTSLELETARIVRSIAAVAVASCAGVALLHVVMRGDPLSAVLAGLTLAMALLPEEFPVVLAIFLALGAWRIARHGVLTRRMPAIEMLGAATVLCCDKTGTLTENRMRVAETWQDGTWTQAADAGLALAPVLETAALACERAPFDPMERAILDAAKSRTGDVAASAAIERHYPLADDFLAVAMARRTARGAIEVAMKGAPETVVDLCRLDVDARNAALDAAADAARRGLRVLAVARAAWGNEPLPHDPRAYDWRLVGLVALADPVRAAVPAAIATCRRAGIRVVMITGDHPATARAIAREAGLDAARVVTGTEIEALDPEALARAARTVQVFARVRPEQKLALVQAFRAAGEVVAMTGDGVNDAPALKAAHIGVAMGGRGTDVAREAAALVLLEDDFTAIVATIRLGRRIYANIRNAMSYLLSVHVPLAGMAFLPLAFGAPVFLYPLHVVFLEFVIDPASTLAFEAEHSDAGTMQRPPRHPAQRLFDVRTVAVALALGGAALALVAGVYAVAFARGAPEGVARALAFITLVTSNLALIFAYRSERLTTLEVLGRGNPVLWSIVAGAATALALAVHWPAAARLFHFEHPGLGPEIAAVLAGLAMAAVSDLSKRLARRDSPA